MTPEEQIKADNLAAQNALLVKVKEATKLELDEFVKTNPEIKSFKSTSESLKALEEKSKTFKTEVEFKSLTDELTRIGLEVKALKETRVASKGYKKGSIEETLAENKSKIDGFIASKSGTLTLEHKSSMTSTDIGSGDSVYSGNTLGRDAYFQWHEGGAIGIIPVRKAFMRQLFKSQTTGTEFIKYIDQDTVVRDAKNVALCGTSTHNTKVTFKVRTMNVDKVRDFTTICLDMMNDYGFVGGQINELLNSSLQLKIDNDLLLGTGVSPILHGVKEIASTFSAANANPMADYTGTYRFAQIIDLISVVGAQIKAFGQYNKWVANAAIMNPKDVQLIKALKNTLGDYLKNNQLAPMLYQDNGGNIYVDGILLVENPLVTANTMWVGDFTRGTVYNRPGVGIEFAYENGTNFEQELVTVKVYERLNLLIRNVDINAFVYVSDIAAGILAITGI